MMVTKMSEFETLKLSSGNLVKKSIRSRANSQRRMGGNRRLVLNAVPADLAEHTDIGRLLDQRNPREMYLLPALFHMLSLQMSPGVFLLFVEQLHDGKVSCLY